MSTTRPVLRYHGGKWRLAPWIISHFPPHRIYVEPYGGAASVLLRKPRVYAEVYNDLEGEVVNLFRVLRNPGQAAELERQLRLTPYAREEFWAAYEPTDEPVERARRTITRAFMGFGSASANNKHRTGFRANSNKSGTTPAHDWANYPDHISSLSARLAGVIIEQRPALEITKHHDTPEALHYLDPPYSHTTRYVGASGSCCYVHEMTDDDHREMAEVVRRLKGMVVLSGYDSPLYQELFGDWEMVSRPAMADGAKPRTECLWLSPAAARAQECLFAGQGAA